MSKEDLISLVGSWLIRAAGLTLRTRLSDEAGFLSGEHPEGCILAFWHNRMFALTAAFEHYYRGRKGAFVLTSPSRDGGLLASFMKRFGIGSVRGSSSRRGATALRELNDLLDKGHDVIITPDGPRGPRYRLGPGIIFLARKSGCPIIHIRVEYSRCLRLKSWDGFMIPLPFSRADITLEKMFWVSQAETDEELEEHRAKLEKAMQPHKE